MVTTAMAQITTSSVSGKITANGEDVIGATIKAVHQPSGTVYRAVTTWMVVILFRVCARVDLMFWK